jgi:hypothetical protein
MPLSEFLTHNGYLDEKEAAAALGKGARTLARWRQQRKGPRYTLNGEEPIYHQVLDYLKSNAKEPVREPACRRRERGERAGVR